MPYHILVHGKTCITVIFDLSILIYGAGVVQNMAILEVKTGLLWQACWGVRKTDAVDSEAGAPRGLLLEQ